MQWMCYKYKWCNKCVSNINDAKRVWCKYKSNVAMSVMQVYSTSK